MLNMETSESKKIIKKKKYLQNFNILKKFIRVMTITNHILNLEINLTIGKLLVLALVIKKQLTKTIIKDKAM